jgi:hypothetical protein
MELGSIIERNKVIKIIGHFLIDLLVHITRLRSSLHAYDGKMVAIISIHKLGDTVFTIPAIEEILKFYNDKNIVIICFPESRAIYKKIFPELVTELVEHLLGELLKDRVGTK